MGLVRLLNAIMTGLFDGIIYPFRGYPWLAMAVVSLLTGLLMLLIFRYTSNQDAIRRSKDLLKAGFLELWLYRNDFRTTLRATAGIVAANFRYVKFALVPFMFTIVPVVLILIQLDLRYGYRGPAPGESVILSVITDGSVPLDNVVLQVPDDVNVKSPPLRIPNRNEVNWKVSPTEDGRHALTFKAGAASTEKLLVSSNKLEKIPLARANSALKTLLHPSESNLEGPFKSMDILYPSTRMELLGYRMHWIIPFLILSIVFAFGLKGVFGVEV